MWVAAGLVVVCALLVAPGLRRRPGAMAPLFAGTGHHWRRRYGRRAFLKLGAAVAGAGVVIYSGLDEAVTAAHDRHLRSADTERIARVGYEGGQRPWFLAWAAVAAIDAWWRSGPLSRWGRANFEAMVVGLPMLWTVQRVLGAGRPSADVPTPDWKPFRNENAASGHAFIGAVPWITAARAVGLRRWRLPLWVGSWLSGWSRLHDRKHYLSQVCLGWYLAWQAVVAVDDRGMPPPAGGSNKESS